MNNLFKKIMPIIFIMMIFSGCYYDITNNVSSNDIVKNRNGEVVRRCDDRLLVTRGGVADRFWKQNNLPEGTTEFVCKNGKAYLPNQVPSN